MTILLDTDNKKILSISSGGFVDKILNTRKYTGEIPEINEEKNEYIEWDDINKKIIIKA
jgi:hypothetical protein